MYRHSHCFINFVKMSETLKTVKFKTVSKKKKYYFTVFYFENDIYANF